MPLINCKIELSLNQYENCILSSAGTAATFAITDTKLFVPVVTLRIENNAKLPKDHAANSYIRERLDASFLGVNKLFALTYAYGDSITNKYSYRKYFHPRLKIKN